MLLTRARPGANNFELARPRARAGRVALTCLGGAAAPRRQGCLRRMRLRTMPECQWCPLRLRSLSLVGPGPGIQARDHGAPGQRTWQGPKWRGRARATRRPALAGRRPALSGSTATSSSRAAALSEPGRASSGGSGGVTVPCQRATVCHCALSKPGLRGAVVPVRLPSESTTDV